MDSIGGLTCKIPSLLTYVNISSSTEATTFELVGMFKSAIDVVSKSSGNELVVQTGSSLDIRSATTVCLVLINTTPLTNEVIPSSRMSFKFDECTTPSGQYKSY